MRSAGSAQLMRRALDWDLSPADVLRRVRVDPHPVALLGAWAGGSDIVASDPVRTCCAPAPCTEVLDEPLPDLAGPPGSGFGGGWLGYLGFGLAGQVLPVPPPPGEPRRLPAWWLGYYDHVLRRDRATGRWTFEALWTPGRAAALERRFGELTRRAGAPPRDYSCGPFGLIPSPAEHQAAVARAIEYIRRGDIFQANICLRLEASFTGDPLDAFCRAATRLDPPYAAYLGLPGGAVASLSPELFLRRTGPAVWSRPIKGTRPRPAGQEAAALQRAALERSAKDRAENMMIVDLMRNDLSRVCLPGSVRVPARLRAEAHPGVWHLVSDVRGQLPAGVSDGQLIAAAFPPGSVTGAPKVRALEVIHELEATPREVYTGAIGYRSPVAGLELNVAIRTFEFAAGRVWLGSGGGIVAASGPAEEYRECLAKATPLIEALDATLSEQPEPVSPRLVSPGPSRPACGPGPRAACSPRCASPTGARRTLTPTWPGWPPAPASSTASPSRPACAPIWPPCCQASPAACGSPPAPSAARCKPPPRSSRPVAPRRPSPRRPSPCAWPPSPAVSARTSGPTAACSPRCSPPWPTASARTTTC